MTATAKKPLLIDYSNDNKNIPKEWLNRCQGKHLPEKSASITRRSTAIVQRYKTPLGALSLRDVSISTTFGSKETNTKSAICSKKILTFFPSFLSRCIEIRHSSIFGVVSRTFRTYPLISTDHPAFNMCRSGNITGLQTCFSRGGVSPFSTDIYGRGLLHVRRP